MKKIYPNVELGENVIIEDFCIIGLPPRGYREGELKTVIGSNSVIRSHTVIYAGNV
ncbi:MAG: transferase, partial [Calditrichaeota bacterium]|nr:transferase [Calditrichota bacterium]